MSALVLNEAPWRRYSSGIEQDTTYFETAIRRITEPK